MFDFVIIGAQKGGTTAATHNLNMHPHVSVFTGTTEYNQYEIKFYDQHWERGTAWYFSHVPAGEGIKGEKTADLLHRTICHERIHQVIPDAKLIVLLRCPIERAYSQWRMECYTKKSEQRTFREAILADINLLAQHPYKERFYACNEKEISCGREGYIIKGFYAEQLKNLYQYFPRHRVHIAITEQIKRDKAREYNRMFSFLEVASFSGLFEERFIGKKGIPIDTDTYGLLKEVYARPNAELFNMLGQEVKEWSV